MLNSNIKAFLDTIAYSEGTWGKGDDGYNVLFGGAFFGSYTDHPRIRTYETHDNFIKNNKLDFTTAAGRYQITKTTYDYYKKILHLSDFSPNSQDAIAIRILQERKAYDTLLQGHFATAIAKVSKIWASLPGAGYNQPERKIEALTNFFLNTAGGTIIS